MTRIAVVMASALLNASTIPSVASECTSRKEIAASRARWATARTESVKTVDIQATCRAYASSFYESVTLRQATALCFRGADRAQNLLALDLEIDAFNDLLAQRCGS